MAINPILFIVFNDCNLCINTEEEVVEEENSSSLNEIFSASRTQSYLPKHAFFHRLINLPGPKKTGDIGLPTISINTITNRIIQCRHLILHQGNQRRRRLTFSPPSCSEFDHAIDFASGRPKYARVSSFHRSFDDFLLAWTKIRVPVILF